MNKVCKCGHSEEQHTTNAAQYHPSNPHIMMCDIAACACREFQFSSYLTEREAFLRASKTGEPT